jgi:hypothetical protein
MWSGGMFKRLRLLGILRASDFSLVDGKRDALQLKVVCKHKREGLKNIGMNCREKTMPQGGIAPCVGD